MKALVSLAAVLVLLLAAYVGVHLGDLRWLFGVVVPYFAAAVFLVGIVVKVIGWGRSPVPFRIPTTCGQQKSLPWIKQDKLDNPATGWQAMGRMALEILAFRSLFRNRETVLRDGQLAYRTNKWLWAAALAFHYSMLIIVLRHLRFFFAPIPRFVDVLTNVDGFLQVGVPGIYITSFVFLGAVTFLLARRLGWARMRYLSLPADYFPLFLFLAIGCTGLWMRHIDKVDVSQVKAAVMGLLVLAPHPPAVGWIFYAHLFCVSTLLAYFPFSKLMHLGGVFLSPTRNLANDNRARHHVNPWNRPLPVHTYAEYEDEFRDRMREAGLPLDKE